MTQEHLWITRPAFLRLKTASLAHGELPAARMRVERGDAAWQSDSIHEVVGVDG